MKGKEGVQRALLIVPIVLTVFLMNPSQAQAGRGDYDDHRHHGKHSHHRYHDYHRPVNVWPGKHVSITIGGSRHHHRHGHYYKRHHRDYVLVPEPGWGVIISTIPHGCSKVYIDGHIYYTYNENYYLKVAGGYRLVDRPNARVSDDVSVEDDVEIRPEVRSGDAFTVNIPNAKGGYTAITLKRSGSGYVGPQGEYYQEFPKVEQLRAMYAK